MFQRLSTNCLPDDCIGNGNFLLGSRIARPAIPCLYEIVLLIVRRRPGARRRPPHGGAKERQVERSDWTWMQSVMIRSSAMSSGDGRFTPPQSTKCAASPVAPQRLPFTNRVSFMFVSKLGGYDGNRLSLREGSGPDRRPPSPRCDGGRGRLHSRLPPKSLHDLQASKRHFRDQILAEVVPQRRWRPTRSAHTQNPGVPKRPRQSVSPARATLSRPRGRGWPVMVAAMNAIGDIGRMAAAPTGDWLDSLVDDSKLFAFAFTALFRVRLHIYQQPSVQS